MKFSSLIAVGLMLSATTSLAETITFEELGIQDCCFFYEEPLTDQYSTYGVNFGGGWEVHNESEGLFAYSGQHRAAYNTYVPGSTNTLEMNFIGTINSISGFLGSTNSANWVIKGFNGATELVTDIFVNAPNTYTYFSLSNMADLGVNRITIEGSLFYGVLDDLSYTAVPVPAAVWLFGSGLLGLIGLARRKA